MSVAKGVFDAIAKKNCVWSDKKLERGYAVDHVIPFTLWHCNELWNLLPCDARINGLKSDRLPEHRLVLERKEPILFYWSKIRERHERRFDTELAAFVGTPLTNNNWENRGFQRLVEAVEITAVQRGAERWRP